MALIAWDFNASYKSFQMASKIESDETKYTLEETEESKERKVDVYRGSKVKGNTVDDFRERLPLWV
jgi:hypothetical protein